jgi:hypothetical protein
MSQWKDLRWFLVLNGIADAWMWAFDADRWELRLGHPAMGTMGILPRPGEPVATLSDALWLADAVAFDHDAPVGVQPAWEGDWPDMTPKDPAALPASQPINPFEGPLLRWYWEQLNMAYGAAAELRFNGSYVLHYGEEDEGSPSTAFAQRFRGREELVSMYVMSARQADPLSEYLCLYRLLEGKDMQNGKTFARQNINQLSTFDFGILRIIGADDIYENATNAFEVYRKRALDELANLKGAGIDAVDRLYRIRNSLAHGKVDVLLPDDGEPFHCPFPVLLTNGRSSWASRCIGATSMQRPLRNCSRCWVQHGTGRNHRGSR